MSADSNNITALLADYRQGSTVARDRLLQSLYGEFLQKARLCLLSKRKDHSLSTGDLADETVKRLLQYDEICKATDTNQLRFAFARTMGEVLADHARKRKALKRGGGWKPGVEWKRIELDDLEDYVKEESQLEILALEEALAALTVKKTRVAEILKMRFYAGYTLAEIAETLNVSLSTTEKDARFGMAWVRNFLTTG